MEATGYELFGITLFGPDAASFLPARDNPRIEGPHYRARMGNPALSTSSVPAHQALAYFAGTRNALIQGSARHNPSKALRNLAAKGESCDDQKASDDCRWNKRRAT